MIDVRITNSKIGEMKSLSLVRGCGEGPNFTAASCLIVGGDRISYPVREYDEAGRIGT